jgi:hypothetical protein
VVGWAAQGARTGGLEANTYHVMSRTCGGEVFFDDVEKEALRRLLWKMSEFCGVRLVTYCIMGNHFQNQKKMPGIQCLHSPELQAKMDPLP